MKPFLLLVSSALFLTGACDRPRSSSVLEPAGPPAPRLNLLLERSLPADPLERARRALEDLERTFAGLPAPARARFDSPWSRVNHDATRVLAELDAKGDNAHDDRRLQLRLRTVPLSLSLFLTDVGLGVHRAQLPEELGHELTHAAERAHRAWSELAAALAGHEA